MKHKPTKEELYGSHMDDEDVYGFKEIMVFTGIILVAAVGAVLFCGAVYGFYAGALHVFGGK